VDRQHPLIGIQRIYWRRWFALGLALLPAAPVDCARDDRVAEIGN